MSIQPHRIEDFNEELFEEIALKEQFRSKIYLDSVGIPTIGYGHAFFTANGSKNIEAFRELEAMGISLSEDDLLLFDEVEHLLKKHPRNIKEIKRLMAKVDLEIDESEAKELFDYVIENRMDGLKQRLGEELYIHLEDSKELLALADLAFNGGPGLIYDSMLKALKEGNREIVWYKIRYATNGKASRSKGIANRRVSESNIFGLTNEKPTAKDIQNIEKMVQTHSANIYKQEHAFPVKHHSPSPNPYGGKNSMKEQLKIAKQYFLDTKDNQIKKDDIYFDKKGNFYFEARLLSGIKYMTSEGIYEDDKFIYKEDENNLIIMQKKDPNNSIVITDWKDEMTQKTLGIVLDNSSIKKY